MDTANVPFLCKPPTSDVYKRQIIDGRAAAKAGGRRIPHPANVGAGDINAAAGQLKALGIQLVDGGPVSYTHLDVYKRQDLPNYILMELWMIWNMVPYLWYRLVIVKFDLK